MTFDQRFEVSRPYSLELSLPKCLRSAPNKITREEFCDAVFRVLDDRAKGNIKCIQMSPNGSSFRLTLKPGSDSTRDRLLYEGIHLKGTFCYFMEAEASFSTITLSNLPSEVPDGPLFDYFNHFFGEVKSVTRNFDKYGIETGDRRILLKLRNHIPHCLKLGNFYVFVKYKYQPLVCFHCNEWGHKNSECPRRRACPRCGEDHRARDCSLSWELPPIHPCSNESPETSTTPNASGTSNPQHNGMDYVENDNEERPENSQDDNNSPDDSSDTTTHVYEVDADHQRLLTEFENSQPSLFSSTESTSTQGRSFSSVVQEGSPPYTFSPPTPLTPQSCRLGKPMELKHTSLKRPADPLPVNKANKSKPG